MNMENGVVQRRAKAEEVEAIYPLSPLQEGLLFHSLFAPESDVYFRQAVYLLEGPLNTVAFERAWQKVVSRHAVLRTAFAWEALDRRLQVVFKEAALPIDKEDWRGIDPSEQQRRLEAYLEADEKRGFTLSEAPLIRVGLMRVSDTQCHLVISHHHVILDGWSSMLLLKEVKSYYEAYAEGREMELGEARPYRDYIEWLEQQDEEEAEEWWRKRLRGFYQATRLPYEGMKCGGEKGLWKKERSLTAGESERLQGQAWRQQLTLNTLVQGAWGLLLGRHRGEKDVVYGATVSGRSPEIAGIESMVGLFINTLPVRVKWSGKEKVGEWLRGVQREQAEAHRYQYAALVEVQRWSEVERGGGLFGSLLVFENYARDAFEQRYGDELKGKGVEEGLRVRMRGGQETVNYPLALIVGPGRELSLLLQFEREVIGEEWAEKMLEQLREMLLSVAEDMEQRVEEVCWMGEKERKQIVEEWNRTERAYPQQRCLHELFEEQAAHTPDAIAVVVHHKQFTYAQLNHEANQLGRYLRKRGVGPEVRVGVCMSRGWEMIVGILGILKARGAYVPLDMNYPKERLVYMLEDAKAEVLLTEGKLGLEFRGYRGLEVRVDEYREQIGTESGQNIGQQTAAQNLAYVIYTSGSTGLPKGVGIQHSSAVGLVYWAREEYREEELRGVLASTSICFDLSVFEIFAPLCWGGKVIVAKDAFDWGGVDAEEQVSLINTVPSAIRELVNNGKVPQTVLTINLAGEAFGPGLAGDIYKGTAAERVMNLYGPTEDTTYSTYARVKKDAEEVTIGRPIANTRVYVLDKEMQSVPVGVTGELYLGGEGLARGYMGRSDLTAERFVPDGFGQKAGGRLYRTGDLVRWQKVGELDFLGRRDQQVKLRGYRIELEEIEAVLEQHDGINQAVAKVQDEGVEKRLVAYVVPKSRDQQTNGQEMRSYLRQHLPEYMVPAAIAVLQELPLTPNGKVDRKALPAVGYQEKSSRNGVELTPVEEIVTGIWCAVLKLETIGLEQSFFDLGGHSLLAMQLISRVRAVLGVDMPLRTVFDAPTLSEFAGRIEAEFGKSKNKDIPPLVRASRETPLPLSFAQQQLWYLDQLDAGSTTYNVLIGIRAIGVLNVPALQKAMKEIVRRHEVLRTNFVLEDGSPVQRVRGFEEWGISTMNVSETANPQETAMELVRKEGKRSFDLKEDWPMRVILMRLQDEDHMLLAIMHHIVSDGWSLGILVREFTELYVAYSRGEESPLPELGIQYGDFAAWQRNWMQGPVLLQQLSYWREKLSGIKPLELPTDYDRPAVANHPGALLQFHVGRELTGKLRQFSQHEGVTLFMTLLAVFQVLLARYCGQEDITVGTSNVNRNRLETESLIGFFVNQLVLRNQVARGQTFSGFLKQVRQTVLDAQSHQDMPFVKLVEYLAPEAELGRTPLFQVALVLQNAFGGELHLPGLTLRGLPLTSENAKFDLNLTFEEYDGELRGTFEYAMDIFSAETIERMTRHWKCVLETAVSEPQTLVWDWSLLSPQEREQQLVQWNHTAAAYPLACIHEIYEEQAKLRPDTVALEYEEQHLTYRELDERANQLGHYLTKLGVTPEVTVGVCLERSLEMMIGILGVLKAGGVYVPLDTLYPTERLSYMVEDAHTPVLLIQEKFLDRLPVGLMQIVCLDRDAEEWQQESRGKVRSGADLDNSAYVIYTSGSTGSPKGVCVSHRNVVRLVKGTNYVKFGSQETFLQLAPISFDAATFEIWGAVLNGGKLSICGAETPSLEKLGRVLEERGITVVWLTAGLFHQMVESQIDKLAKVEQVVAGGDVLTKKDVTLALRAGVKRLVNGYGPTEATTFSCCGDVRESDLERSVLIGRPVGNTQAYVLDESLEPIPAGVAGELYIGGDGVGRGYCHQGGLTAERFLPNAHSSETQGQGQRLYRTGDRVRWVRDGQIEFLGRKDQQVKIRGYRIELQEIEHVLEQHAGVKQAIIEARTGTSAEDKRLVAYVVVHEEGGEGVKPDDLRRYLGSKLPDYMVPSAYVAMDKMPLTANGKIDRRQLPAPEWETEAKIDEAHPKTVVEELLAGIWAEVLGLEAVGPEANFFGMGGHSLLATQVISRARQVFSVELPLRAIFEGPTVREMAARIEEGRQEGKMKAAPPIKKADRNRALPLSYAQQRLWFIEQMDPGNGLYNVPFGLRLTGTLDPKGLQYSLNEMVRRHEVLRTRFVERDAEPVQEIDPRVELQLPILDLSAAHDSEDAVRKEMLREARQGFDLATGPLWRAKLLRLGELDHVLLIVLHHIVSDEWTLRVMVREFRTFYSAYISGQEPDLPEMELQYADFAVWQREWLQGEVLDEQLEYWKHQLAGLNPLALPKRRNQPATPSHSSSKVVLRIEEELTRQLRGMSQKHSATLFMTLLASFQLLLGRYAGQDDVVVGSPVANRTRLEIEGLIGFLVNQLVLRSDLSGSPSFKTLLERVRGTVLGAYDHQDLPFEKLVEELAPERSRGRVPLFQVAFAMQHDSQEFLELPGLNVRGMTIEQDRTKWDAVLWIHEQADPDGLLCVFEYTTDLFEPATMESLVAAFHRVLAQIADDPERGILELSLLDEAEKNQVLKSWNQTAAEYPDTSVNKLFEEQAERSPDVVAVVYQEQRVTYGDLNRKANQLARYLQDRGAGPEVRVALCVERGLEMIVGILGTLKAGAAYVPLDPRFPMERLAYMLEDSQAAFLLTQKRYEASLPTHWSRVICLDTDWDEIAEADSTNPEVQLLSDNLAYVIYTSGSTGQPKGVCIAHRNLMNYITAIRESLRPTMGSSFALISTFAADLGNTVLFPSLCGGGTLHPIQESIAADDVEIEKYFQNHRIDILKVTPSQLWALMGEKEQEGIVPLRHLLIGGEAWRAEWAQRLQKAQPGCQLWNHYGPTECTVGVLMNRVENADVEQEGTILLGRPIQNTKAFVLDPRLEPVAVGVSGEICIGGASVGRGYLNRPDLTAERFIPDLFDSEGERIYRTGDLGRWYRDGKLEFLGRKDEQVKVRGYRVELAEIETVVRQQNGVKQCAVIIREKERGQAELVAYVVPHRQAMDASKYHLPNGIDITHQNNYETEYLFDEIFNKEVYLQNGIVLPEDACVFDVGANIGMFTLFVADRCPKGRIFSFEPVGEVFEKLKSNAGGCRNIVAFNWGLSDKERETHFTFYPRYSMMSGLADYANPEQDREVLRTTIGNKAAGGDTTAVALLEHEATVVGHYLNPTIVECRLRRLSDIIGEQKVDRIDLLKIDVQRSEVDVLRGLVPQDWEKVQQVVLEVHDKRGWETEGRIAEISRMLEKQGFAVRAMQCEALESTDRWNVYAKRPGYAPGHLSQPGFLPRRAREKDTVSIADLRRHTEQKLPYYMVPSVFVLLKEMPLTENGKVDRRRLPELEVREEKVGEYKEPESVEERILAGVWKQVLGVERVGREDNFFELGGDSILSIKVVSRAMQAGVEITVPQIFQHQSLKELARVAGKGREGRKEREGREEEEVKGKVPLTPVQEWFFERELEAGHHFNQAVMLRTREGMEVKRLRRVVEGVMKHHDGIRLRFERGEGGWEQRYEETEGPEMVHMDLREVSEERQKGMIEEVARQMQGSLDLQRGPLARVVYMELGGEGGGRLLWVLHHLIVDGVSWRILLEDWHMGWRQLEMGGEMMLPAKSMSWKKWAEALKRWAASEELAAQESYWLRLAQYQISTLPRDFHGGINTVMSRDGVDVELEEELTTTLLRRAIRRFHVQMEELLLTAVVTAVSAWTHENGVLVELEGHGREAIFPSADTSRTLGWFTSHFPVWFAAANGNLEQQTTLVKTAMADVPQRGIGCGVLRHLAPNSEVRDRMRKLPQPEIIFNYLGQLDEALPNDSLLEGAPEPAGPSQNPRQHHTHNFEIIASISGRKLFVRWTYSREAYRAETIMSLANSLIETLRKLARLCLDAPGEVNPSNFPLARLNSEQLRSIMKRVEQGKK
ncbi:MAG TPA: amino acid adenylation domain-containing protein [Candidatus Angelobacter sp.]|jgi:amino acid adenylation domain-containing protein/non-ribosomal peptide synthase protein (TIGR01720 family)/FkbM family methyltransferase